MPQEWRDMAHTSDGTLLAGPTRVREEEFCLDAGGLAEDLTARTTRRFLADVHVRKEDTERRP